MLEYDEIGVNTIVADISGGLSTCDLPFCDALDRFSAIYDELTEKVRLDCTDFELPDRMIIGTSNLAAYDIDGVVNMYSGIFNNPFLIWGKYRRQEDRTLLSVSFQFHHVQMTGWRPASFWKDSREPAQICPMIFDGKCDIIYMKYRIWADGQPLCPGVCCMKIGNP